MKHFFLVVLILVACAAFAQGVPTPAEPRLMTGPDGSLVSPTNPLPVKDANAASSSAALLPPVSLTQQTAVLVAATVTALAPTTGRTWVTLKAYADNTETIWVSWNNAAASATVGTGDQLSPGARISRQVPVGYIIGVIASGAESLYYSQEVR